MPRICTYVSSQDDRSSFTLRSNSLPDHEKTPNRADTVSQLASVIQQWGGELMNCKLTPYCKLGSSIGRGSKLLSQTGAERLPRTIVVPDV